MRTHTINQQQVTAGSELVLLPRAIRRGLRIQLGAIMLLLVLLFGYSLHGQAVRAESPRDRAPGIRNSQQARRSVSQLRLNRIAASLENLTGLTGIKFGGDGALTLEEAKLDQFGSATAREILFKIVETVSVTVEDWSRSMEVAFAKLTPGVVYLFPTGRKVPAYTLMVDFSDFQHLGGDENALKAFDLGFVVLHELVHAAENKRDPVGRNGVYEEGDCEKTVNLVRQELGLPVRVHYRSERVSMGSSVHLTFERIRFARKDGDAGEEVYYVQWPTTFVAK